MLNAIPYIQPLLAAIEAASGRPHLVGGAVRDLLRGEPVKDVDIEVYGLPIEPLVELLRDEGLSNAQLDASDGVLTGCALGVAQTEQVLRLVRRLADNGKTIIFITHKLNEVMEISDRATVLRGRGRDEWFASVVRELHDWEDVGYD